MVSESHFCKKLTNRMYIAKKRSMLDHQFIIEKYISLSQLIFLRFYPIIVIFYHFWDNHLFNNGM